MSQSDDILQQAILDVNKIKQVSLKVAQEKLHQQYSKDLRKKYIEEMTENFTDNEDITLFEEVNDMFGEDPENTEDPSLPNPASSDSATAPVENASATNVTPPGMENGLPPQAGAVQSQIPQSDIPTAGVDEDNGSIIVLQLGDNDSPYDLDAGEADLKAQTSELLAAQQGPPTEENIGNEDNSDMLPPNEQGKRTDDFIFSGIFDEEDPYMATEGSIKISDEILLEYIQKSLNNDEKFNKLSETIDNLQKTVNDLANQLKKSNSDLVSLKEQNIRLIFKNQALNDDSLSEPQKQSIVKALDKATTLNEAKTVYETVSSSISKTNNKNKDVNSIISDNVTKKFIMQEKTKPVLEEKTELTSITKKLFEKWGI